MDGTDPVGALLVLLELGSRHTEALRDAALRERRLPALLGDALPDIDVALIGLLTRHEELVHPLPWIPGGKA